MFYLFLIVSIASLRTATCDGEKKQTIQLPLEFLGKVFEAALSCSEELGVDTDILQKMIPWQLEESEENGKFIYCLSKKFGFVDNTGHLYADKFMVIFKESSKREEIKSVLDICNKEHGTNRYYTMYKIANCFQHKTPVMISLE